MRFVMTRPPNQRRFHNFQSYRADYLRLLGHEVVLCDGTRSWLDYDAVLLDYMPEVTETTIRSRYAKELASSIAADQRRFVFYDDEYYPPQCAANELALGLKCRYKLVTDILALNDRMLVDYKFPQLKHLAFLDNARMHIGSYFAVQPAWLPDDLPVLPAANELTVYAGAPKSDRKFPDWVFCAKRIKKYEHYERFMRTAKSNIFANSASHGGQITPRLWESMFYSPCVFDSRFYSLRDWDFKQLAPNASREDVVQHQRSYMRQYAADCLHLQRNVL